MPERKPRKKKNITLSLDEETIDKLDELAWESHKPMSQWVTDAVWKADKENVTREDA